jgi:hypothetical protein
MVRSDATQNVCSGYVLMSQDVANMHANTGDSGSPVFIQGPLRYNDARLAGMLWGIATSPSESWYSPFVFVQWELTREDRDQACPPYEQAGHCWLGLKIR